MTRTWRPAWTRDAEGRKQCSTCDIWLSVDSFYRSQSNKDGLMSQCSLCDRLGRYGIDARDYNAMLERQQGLCVICRREPSGPFNVDHDHACCPERKRSCGGCIRGLLCSDCNGGLGFFNDDIVRLQAAIKYLGGDAK